MSAALDRFLYGPEREFEVTPADAGLAFDDLKFETRDGERIHGWWIGHRRRSRGHVLFCQGNAGNIGDRVLDAALLAGAGFGRFSTLRGFRPDQDRACIVGGGEM